LSSVQLVNTQFTQPGTYTVSLFVGKGKCLDTKKIIITVEVPSELSIPNVFTLNNDGVNDIFFLKTASLNQINARIYDRWGHKIYEAETDNGNIVWDGKNQQNIEVPSGTYFYIIKAVGKDGEAYNNKGNLSLFR